MNLEGSWPVRREQQTVGQCCFESHGLYWHIRCQCDPGSREVSRLVLFCGSGIVSLGILVPENGTWVLERRLAKGHFPAAGEPRLFLLDAAAPMDDPEAQPDIPIPAPPPEPAPQKPPEFREDPQAGEQPGGERLPEAAPNLPESRERALPLPEAAPLLPMQPTEPQQSQQPNPPEQPPALPANGSVAYDPAAPLPMVEQWQRLRAAPDGAGGFLLQQSEETPAPLPPLPPNIL